MLNKKSIFAATLLSGLFVSSSVQASEISLEQLVSHLVGTAVVATQNEIQMNIQEAVLTASNMFDLDSQQEAYATKVKITDLPAEEMQADAASE